MSKIFSLTFAVLCAIVLGVAPANAEPITIAIFGSAFASTFLGAVVTGVIWSAVSFAATYAFNLLFPSKDQNAENQRQDRDPAQVQYGERVARSGILGKKLVGGHKVLVNEYDNATKLQQVFVLADWRIAGLSSIYVDGRQYALNVVANSGNNEHVRYNVDTFGTLIDIRLHDGRVGQLADTQLVATNTGWNSTRRFSSQAYVVVTVQSDKEKFNSVPDFKFVVNGLYLYDPRLDTTVGGSGPQRWNDQSTWALSYNNGVQAYNFLRGFYFNNQRILGAGLSVTDIDFDSAIAVMNICDEIVNIPGGGTRKRYENHMSFDDTQAFADVLDEICAGMGGFFAEKAGRISLFAGKAQVPVKTITDADLIDDETIVFSPKKPGVTLYTGIQGTYTNSVDFVAAPYTEIEPAEFVSADGKSSVLAVDYQQIQQPHQAYLIAKQELFKNRSQATASISLDIKDMLIEIGDWVIYNSASVLRGSRTYRVIATMHDFQAMRMRLSLQETSNAVYADDATAADVVQPVRTRPIAGYIKQVNNFAVTPTILEGASGERLPALRFNYDPIFDPAVASIKIEYRLKGGAIDSNGETQVEGPTIKVSDPSPNDGSYFTTNALTPGKVYEARAQIDSIPGREAPWSDWLEASFATEDMVTVVEVPDDSIDIIKLTQEVQNQLGLLTGTGPGSVFNTIQAIKNRIEALASSNLTDQTNFRFKTDILSIETSKAAAAVITEAEVRASEDEAYAALTFQAIAELESELGDIINNSLASGLLKFEAEVAPGGASATIMAKVRASMNDTFSEAAWILRATASGGGTTSDFGVIADRFFITNGTNPTSPFKFIGGVATMALAKIDVVESGILRSADEKFVISLDDKRISIST